jgi:hypothetical protein
MDFYIDIGAAVLLRLLKEGKPDNKYRKLFLKIFRAIAMQYSDDPDFKDAAKAVEEGLPWK